MRARALQRGWGAAGLLGAAATVRAPGSGSEAVVVLASPRLGGHFGGIISVATFLCRRLVVVAASSSSSLRRRRRRVVVASCRRCVVSSVPASILTPGPHHRCRSSRCRVFASIPRLSSPPPTLTTSAGRRVVSSVPASILTAMLTTILTGILTAILAPDPHHLTPRFPAPLPETREGGRLQRL